MADIPVILAPWLTVRLGTYKRPEAYAVALAERGMRVGHNAAQMIPQVTVALRESDLTIFLGSARDFGLTRETPLREIFGGAERNGYFPCPAEVGPAARLQYRSQPMNERIRVAMDPIWCADRIAAAFLLQCGGDGVWLGTDDGRPDSEWSPETVWAWCRRGS